MASTVVEICDPARDSAIFADFVAVSTRSAAELNPSDPPPSELELYGYFNLPADKKARFYVALVDGAPVGFGYYEGESDPTDNMQMAAGDVWVAPEHRRHGLGRHLLSRIVEGMEADRQTSLLLYAPHYGDPDGSAGCFLGDAFATRFGLTARQGERCSRAQRTDIDLDLMAEWIEGGRERAAGYRVELFTDPVPEEYLAGFLQAEAGMDDAPMDDIDYTNWTRDAESYREIEKFRREYGMRAQFALALSPDGEPAGSSSLFVQSDRPFLLYQGNTAVLGEHRGKALGRWLKAANYLAAAAMVPEHEVIETYNAQSNPWMLDINTDMGFRPHHIFTAYQADRAAIVAKLSA